MSLWGLKHYKRPSQMAKAFDCQSITRGAVGGYGDRGVLNKMSRNQPQQQIKSITWFLGVLEV